jgi:hypothetical protein
MDPIRLSPRTSRLDFLGAFAGVAFGAAGAAAAPAPFSAAPLAFEWVRFGGEPSAPSAAARREPFRAGRAAGTMSAGRSARVRGATMVERF